MRKILAFVLLVLTACSTDHKASETNIAQSDTTQTQAAPPVNPEFISYLDQLPKLTLPYETDCDHCCSREEINYDDPLISKFRPEGGSIVGLVRRTENQAIILVTYAGDLIIPSLKVYDLQGKLLAEKNFMTNYCGGEPGFYSKQFFKIDANVLVSEIDSVFETTYDSITYATLDTTDIKITRAQFSINEQGEFVEGGGQ